MPFIEKREDLLLTYFSVTSDNKGSDPSCGQWTLAGQSYTPVRAHLESSQGTMRVPGPRFETEWCSRAPCTIPAP